MKFAVHMLAYNVSRFIRPVIENAGPHVDVIYVVYSRHPFAYNKRKRGAINPTRREELLETQFAHKTVIIDGDWNDEEEPRNACLERARQDGCDYLLVQDADEFYTNEAWHTNKLALTTAVKPAAYKTRWYNFWKSPEYVIQMGDGSITDVNASFAVPCNSNIRFVKKRSVTGGDNIGVLPGICYHYGYALTDEEMLEKISTWGHTVDLFNGKAWYRYKWLGWTPGSRNLNAIFPTSWPRAVKFTEPVPHFAVPLHLEVHTVPKGPPQIFGELVYDIHADMWAAARRLKRTLLKSVGGIKNMNPETKTVP
jgi:signal peptidase I